jgi:hypothetical protein
MPVVKTVSVNYERKVNLGDYNSATVGCTIWADVRDGEDLHEAMTALWEMAKANVKEQVLPLVPKQSAQVRHLFLGLPQTEAISSDNGDGQAEAA